MGGWRLGVIRGSRRPHVHAQMGGAECGAQVFAPAPTGSLNSTRCSPRWPSTGPSGTSGRSALDLRTPALVRQGRRHDAARVGQDEGKARRRTRWAEVRQSSIIAAACRYD